MKKLAAFIVFVCAVAMAQVPVKIVNPYLGVTEDRIMVGVPSAGQMKSATEDISGLDGDVTALGGNISNSYVVVTSTNGTFNLPFEFFTDGRPSYNGSLSVYYVNGFWILDDQIETVIPNQLDSHLPPANGWPAGITVEFFPAQLATKADTDLSNVTGIAQQAYGSVYIHDGTNVLAAVTNAYTPVVTWKTAVTNDQAPSINATLMTNGITVLSAGTYKVSHQLSYSGVLSGDIEAAIMINGVHQAHAEFERKLGTGGDVGSASAHGLFYLESNDVVNVAIVAVADADQGDYLLKQAQLIVTKVGLTVQELPITQDISAGTTANVPSGAAVKAAFASEESARIAMVTPAVFVPSTIYCATGIEANIFFDNLLIRGTDTDFSWDVGGISAATQQSYRVMYTPSAVNESNTLWITTKQKASGALIASNSVVVLVSDSMPVTNISLVVDATNTAMSAVVASRHGYGSLYFFSNNFNRVVIPFIQGTNTAPPSFVNVEVRNITYSADNGSVIDVRNGTLVASGTCAVDPLAVSYTNVTVDLNAIVTSDSISGDAMHIGYIAYDSTGTTVAQISKASGGSLNINTNVQTQFWGINNQWEAGTDTALALVQYIAIEDVKSCLLIGDSVFAGVSAGVAMAPRLNQIATNDITLGLSFIGTRSNSLSSAETKDEAVSGWTLANHYSLTNSAFVKPTGGTFDFEYFCTNNSFAAPDYVIVHLGINNLLGQNEAGAETLWAAEAARIEAVHTSITNYSPTTKLVLCPPIVPAFSQEAAGRNYGTTYVRDNQKAAQVKWAQLMHDEFSGREADGIYIVPLTQAIDTRNDFPTETVAISQRNTNTVVRQSNLVHPGSFGAWKMADAIYSFIKWDSAR